MTEEIWKDIEGYEGLYEVSDQGRVRSLNYNHSGEPRVLKAGKNNNGYLSVVLCKNGDCKKFSIHRLVANAFIKNDEGFQQVNHKDEDKENNKSENLEWCNAKYNSNYGSRNERNSEARKGDKNPMYGKHHSEETKKKLSEANKGKNCKTVYMIDKETGEILNAFKSITEAEKITGMKKQNISSCCLGKIKSAGRYKLEYLPTIE